MVTSAFVFIGFVFSSLLLVLGGCGASLAAGYAISGEEIGDRGFISHAFVQTDSELHYFRDVSSQEIAHVNKSPEIKSSVDQPLQLEPNKLVFEESSLGLPKRAVVSLFNPNEEPILINAISSKTLDFYFSFPENKLVKPLGKSRFVVTYLPRKEGAAEAKLTLHTSAGVVEYEVSAHARGNPYRIRPSLKARLPVNGTFEFPIVLHNPHADKLRLINAFSSDSELTLVHRKHDNVQLELAPFETVDFAQAIAVGATERNATVFVVLKLDAIPFSARLPKRRVVLIMAVDLEVTSQPGLFSTVDVLDFGLIKYGERSQRLVFRTYSTVEKGLEIDSVYVDRTSHQSNGVYLQFASKPPISVKSRTKNQPGVPVPISNIEIDTAYLSLNHSKKMHLVEGQIVAESRGGNFNATVRFQATVFLGDILSSTKDAVFHHSLRPPIRRSISVQNNYPFGLAVWNVSMLESKKRYFEVSTIRPVVEIAAGKSSPIMFVKYLKRAPVNFTVSCFVHTNVTTFEIPFLIFRGDIKVTINSLENDNTKFDFGLVKPNTERQMFFTVTNPNLVAIVLRGLSDPYEALAKIEPIGTEYGNGTMLSDLNRAFKPHNWIPIDFPLPARSFTTFRLRLSIPPFAKTPKELSLRLATDYETFSLPIVYGLANSTLSFVDQQLHLGDSAPGKVSTKEIRVFNSFKKDLKVLRISKLTTDKRFFFNLKTKGDLWLKSGAVTTLGNLSFAPGLTCGASCYVGLPLHTDGGQWFKHGLKLPPDLPDIDSHLYDRLRRRFNALESKTIRTSVIVDTDEVKSLEIGVQTELTWPRLLNHPVVHFPLTAVGNFTILNLTLHNPSVHPVVVQLLPLVVYPGAKALLEFFENELVFPIEAPVEMNETLMFSLRDTELFTLKPGSPVPRLREQLEDVVGGSVPRFTLSMLLQPGMSTRVRVGFLPTDYTLRSSLLLIRNNLTAIEPVVMYGKGAHVNMEIDGKASRSGFLLFDILHSHLSDCHNPKRLTHKLPTTLTVKRTFVVKNTGEVNFSIVNVSVSGSNCEDRGFRVLNCQPFSLGPNETHSLEIAYTPDFLMSVNEASLQLYMHMNGTPWIFDLIATVAPEMLPVCHAALPRPPFEWVMYYSCLFALVFCMIYVSACAYLEGDHFISCIIQQSLDSTNEKNGLPPNPERPDAAAAQKTWREAVSSRIAIITRVFRQPIEPHAYFDFGNKPLATVAAKVLNYGMWFFSIIRQVIANEPRLPQRRHRRNRRRSPATVPSVPIVPEAPKRVPTAPTRPPVVSVPPVKAEPEVEERVEEPEEQIEPPTEPPIKPTEPTEPPEVQPEPTIMIPNGRSIPLDSDQEPASTLKRRKNVTKKKSDEPVPASKVDSTPPVQYVKPTIITKPWTEPKIEVLDVDGLRKEADEKPLENGHSELPSNGVKANSVENLKILPSSTFTSDAEDASSKLSPLGSDFGEGLTVPDEEKANSSEGSEIPEWAETSIAEVNVNQEFESMVERSSAFNRRANSAMSCSSQSTRISQSQSDNMQGSSTSTTDDKKKKRRHRQKKANVAPFAPRLTSRDINRLTREYKQHLEAMANGIPVSGMPVGFLPPPLMGPPPPPMMSAPNYPPDFNGFVPPTASNDGYYEQLLRFQQQQQQEEDMQRRMMLNRQRPEQPPPPADAFFFNGAFPWAQQPPPPIPAPVRSTPDFSTPPPPIGQPPPTSTANENDFDALSADLFNELGSARVDPTEGESINLLDLVPQAGSSNGPPNFFSSFFPAEDRIWQPIGEVDDQESLWPKFSADLLDDVDKKEK